MNGKDVVVIGVAMTGLAWALGCGSDDPGNPPPGVTTIEVRNGTWAIAESSSYFGADSCLARGEAALDTTDVICTRSLIEADPDFPVTCSITQTGTDVTFDCRLRVDLGICNHIIRFIGGGTVTDTTFDMVFDVTQEVLPKDPDNAETCELFYGRFVDDCDLQIHSVGSWLDPGPTCTIDGPSIALPGSETAFTSTVTPPGEVDYSWSISGNGRFKVGTPTNESAVIVVAGPSGSYTLTLDLGKADCPFICTKTVTVSATAASGLAESSASSVSAPGHDHESGTKVPFASLLSNLLRAKLKTLP